MLIALLFSAINVTYAPATSNDYHFICLPETEYFNIPSHGYYNYTTDYQNSAVKLSNGQIVGYIRDCPISGSPFSSFLRHESLAWIWEAIVERKKAGNLNETLTPQQMLWSGDYMKFGKKSILIYPDFSFTNSYCVANPQASASAFLALDYSDVINQDIIRNYYGGNSSLYHIPYTPSEEVVSGRMIKMDHFQPIVSGLQGFSTGARYLAWYGNNCSNDLITTTITGKGTHIDGEWGSDHEFHYTVVEDDGTESDIRNRHNRFIWDYSHSKTRRRYFYLSGWDSVSSKYTKVLEASETYHITTTYPSSTSGDYYVALSCKTNVMMVGGFNRLHSIKIFHLFRCQEWIKNDIGDVISSFDKRVVVPDNGTVTWKGASLNRLYWAHVQDENYPDMISFPLYQPSLLLPLLMNACGSEWQKHASPDTPADVRIEDFDDVRHKGHKETTSTKTVEQRITYGGSYVFVNVKFRMK